MATPTVPTGRGGGSDDGCAGCDGRGFRQRPPELDFSEEAPVAPARTEPAH